MKAASRSKSHIGISPPAGNALLSTQLELLSAALTFEQRERARDKQEHQAQLWRAREDRMQAMVRGEAMLEEMGRVRAESTAARSALAFHVDLNGERFLYSCTI